MDGDIAAQKMEAVSDINSKIDSLKMDIAHLMLTMGSGFVKTMTHDRKRVINLLLEDLKNNKLPDAAWPKISQNKKAMEDFLVIYIQSRFDVLYDEIFDETGEHLAKYVYSELEKQENSEG